MAGIGFPMQRTAERELPHGPTTRLPRLLMSWEDWLTFIFLFVAFISVAISIQQADWVKNPSMPSLFWTTTGALVVGLFAARTRLPAWVLPPVALALGVVIVTL